MAEAIQAAVSKFLSGLAPSDRKVHAHFGVSLDIAIMIWQLILLSEYQWDIGIKATHLIWTLYFLKVYPTGDTGSARCGVDEKTFRKYVYYMIEIVLPLVLPQVRLVIKFASFQFSNDDRIWQIDFGERYDGWAFAVPCVIIDGTDLPILKPPVPEEFKNLRFDFLRLWWSHKLRTFAVKYEIGVHVVTGRIIWINGPFKGGTHDLTIARGLLKKILRDNEKALADRGYCGDDSFVTATKGRRNADDKRLDDVRRKVEIVIGRVKFFNCLYHTYRGDVEFHPKLFSLVCRIVNLNLEEAPLRALPSDEFDDHEHYGDQYISDSELDK